MCVGGADVVDDEVATVLLVVNAIRTPVAVLGHLRISAAVQAGTLDPGDAAFRSLVYLSREWILADLPDMLIVSFVARELGEFDDAAVLSLVISASCMLGSCVWVWSKLDSEAGYKECILGAMLVCPWLACVAPCVGRNDNKEEGELWETNARIYSGNAATRSSWV